MRVLKTGLKNENKCTRPKQTLNRKTKLKRSSPRGKLRGLNCLIFVIQLTHFCIDSEGVPYSNSSYIHHGWVVRGKFNIAYVEQVATNKRAILKIIDKHSDFDRELSFLARLGKTLAADYVVELKDVLKPINGELRFGLVEEPLGANLWDYLRQRPSLGELEKKTLALNVVNAVAALHSQRVVHGDFKPHQVCFVPNQPGFKVKLVDFDSAFSLDDENHRIDRYTLLYAAPEVHPASAVI